MTATDNNAMDTTETLKEGLRASKLREAMTRALANTQKKWSYDRVASCFPAVVESNPDSFKHAHAQVEEFLRKAVMEEYENILISRDVVRKLNDLDGIIAEAQHREQVKKRARNAYVPNLEPQQAMRAALLPVKQRELERLQQELAALERENAELTRDITLDEDKMKIQKDSIDQTIAELEASVDLSSQVPIKEMQLLMDEIMPHLKAAS